MRPLESFIAQPIRSLQTMLRVLSQYNQQDTALIPDGIYGPTTLFAVSSFQKQNNLPVTGVTNKETWDKIAEAYAIASTQIQKPEKIQILIDPEDLQQGSIRGPYRYLLEGMLMALSDVYSSIPSPAEDGSETSLKAFQSLADIPITGTADKVTWKNLVMHYTLLAHSERLKSNNMSMLINE